MNGFEYNKEKFKLLFNRVILVQLTEKRTGQDNCST